MNKQNRTEKKHGVEKQERMLKPLKLKLMMLLGLKGTENGQRNKKPKS